MGSARRRSPGAALGEEAQPYNIDSKLVLGAIVTTAVGYPLLRSTVSGAGSLTNHVFLTEYVVTLFTAIWYWIRYQYTLGVTASIKGFPSIASTLLILFLGLACFPFAGMIIWRLLFPLVLSLAVLKDVEVILYQHRLALILPSSNRKKWKAQFLICLEWYNIVRDLLLAAWWAVYAVLITWFGMPRAEIMILFSLPYCMCLIGLMAIKVTMHNIEF